MQNLIYDCLLSILALVNKKDLLNCSLVNKHFNAVSNDNSLWESEIKKYIKHYYPKSNVNDFDWKLMRQYNLKLALSTSNYVKSELLKL